jgi:hypothetical protein
MGSERLLYLRDIDDFNMHQGKSTEQYDLPWGLIAFPNK